MSRPNDEALRAFISNMVEIHAHLITLTRYVENHMEEAPEEIHWGHVGSAGHVLESLSEIGQFLNLK